ncbi:MAG: S8 family peptidase [Flavobacteriales bacterium]|nr:S8 family peptidase [Flavobacteriales bacterium]
MANQYKHIFLSGNVITEKYKTKGTPITPKPLPIRNRAAHSAMLLRKFDAIWAERERLNEQREAEQIPTREGTYLSFKSAANHDLITKSLESLRSKDTKNWIRLLNIKMLIDVDGNEQSIATVYIPNGKEGHFVKKVQEYQQENYRDTENPKNADLVNSIEDVSIALLESLWTDNLQLIPTVHSKWCEVWLNVNTKEQNEQEQIAIFKATLENIGIEYKPNSIIFPERAVLLINVNQNQLIELMMQSDLLAEFRAGQEPAGFWINESAIEQQAWVENLLQRIKLVDSNVKVCVLDSGVNNGHQLLQPLLNDANTLTVEPVWGTNDHYSTRAGHGTLMAGIAGYGKLEEVLASTNNIAITHNLCSVKILPPPTQDGTRKELWGDVTAQGISRAEIQNPEMVLIYCMAVTSTDDVNRGRPSSWSGAIDNLAFGDGENQKLILISAGNINEDEAWRNYPASNFKTTIENPAQSWNALTIGAYTEKIHINDANYKGYAPLAHEGELSPYSTTSLIWDKKWPIKPDVVFEGGNLLKAPDNSVTPHEDLELLSTSKSFNIKPFDTINATSAATAQASWFAAKIAYEYPNAWAETIRGLMVHSAKWNDAMFRQMNVKSNNRGDYNRLLKTFGYGFPDLDKALYSQESALTFVSQEIIQPFGFNSSNQPETNEIHLFNFPWPEDLLLSMSEVPVKLKITLSYFVQPGAGEIGWKDKYRYQSHGLRFDINNVGESEDAFRKRINVAAREVDEQVNGSSGSERWAIGVNNRSNGSIHSDYWEGTAAALSTCHFIAVYPIIGWWRERKHLGQVENQTRYSLIVSLETPAQDIELYTTVKNMIEVPIEIPTS